MGLFGRSKDKQADGQQRTDEPAAPTKATKDRAGSSPESRNAGSRNDTTRAKSTKQLSLSDQSAVAGRQSPKKQDPTSAGAHDGSGDNMTRGGHDVASIGKSIIIKGELTGSEDLEVDGTVDGDIKLADHELTIGPNGRVTASVTAKNIQIVGRVSGNVAATERVEIQASGVVEGDISAPRLLVQEGAVVNGAVSMTGGTKGASTAKPTQPSQSGPNAPAERKAG